MTPRQLLGQARVHTFEYVPYLASYIYSLREQETPGIGTAAVDAAGNLYWCPKFLTEIGKEQAAYVVAHETLHLIFAHHARALEIMGENAGPLERLVCNVAGDLVIEQTLHMMRHLRPAGCVHLGCRVPQWDITLDLPENRSMQEYYRLIMEMLRQKNESDTGTDTTSQEEDDDEDGDNGAGGEAADGDDEDESEEGGSPTAADDAGTPTQEPGSPGTGGSCADGQPRSYEIESDGSWETYAGDMAAANTEKAIAEYEASHPGSVPASIKTALQMTLRPTPNPFDQLRSAVCSSVAAPVGGRDFSRRRRSRHQPPDDHTPLLHGRITVQPHAVVIVDTSASMLGSETKAQAMSVIAQGLRKLTRVTVYCADVHVQSRQTVSGASRFDWQGGGGTDMSTAIEQAEKDSHPTAIILITDAETHWSQARPHARVVVAYTGKVGSRWHRAIPSWFKVVPLTTGA